MRTLPLSEWTAEALRDAGSTLREASERKHPIEVHVRSVAGTYYEATSPGFDWVIEVDECAEHAARRATDAITKMAGRAGLFRPVDNFIRPLRILPKLVD